MPATFADLTNLVLDSAKFSENEWAQQMLGAQESREIVKLKGNRRVVAKTFVLSQKPTAAKDVKVHSKLCCFCDGDHQLWRCTEFVNQSVTARRSFVLQKLLCFVCLRAGHKAASCKLKRHCAECDKAHNTLLHEDVTTPNEEIAGQRSVIALTNGKQSEGTNKRTFLSIVPVHVWKPDGSGSVSTYALLDTGSTTNLCTKGLAKRWKLHVVNDCASSSFFFFFWKGIQSEASGET